VHKLQFRHWGRLRGGGRALERRCGVKSPQFERWCDWDVTVGQRLGGEQESSLDRVRGDRTTLAAGGSPSFWNRQDTAFRVKRTSLCGEKATVFYFEESCRLQLNNRFGRATSSRRSREGEGRLRLFWPEFVLAQFNRKNAVHRMDNATAVFPALARQQSLNTENSTFSYGGLAFCSSL
jgi:hypothetical protein